MSDYTLGGNFTPGTHESRIKYDQTGVRFKPVMSRDGQTLWMVPDNRNAHYIWCSGGKGSRGLGGNEKEFPLAYDYCGSITLKGPWHANPLLLYEETGIDLRQRHETWGVLGTGFAYNGNGTGDVITNLIHIDASPVIGSFDRIEEIGEALLNAGVHEMLFYYSESPGGSSYGRIQ